MISKYECIYRIVCQHAPDGDLQDNLPNALRDFFVADSHSETLPCFVVHSSIMGKIDHNLALLLAFTSASSHD